MKRDKMAEAIELARRIGWVFVATADSGRLPHIAAAGKLESIDTDIVAITEWFCPATLENLQQNRLAAVVVWDKSSDKGFQITGRLIKIEEIGILDGYTPREEKTPVLPQVRRRMLIKVERIIDFRLGPHSDADD